ncbi:MAG: alpha/beta hydrolase [Bacteroidales bacterium]|nr:alpha/beta hydrolase [Bacteroidales bacterium]
MQHEEFEIKNAENRILALQSWAPNQDEVINGVFCFVHGIGEHLSRYEHWAERSVAKGYVFFGLDLCCSGKSEGKIGFFYSYDSIMDDIDLLIKQAEMKFPGMPLYLYGHSMGGNIVLNYGLRKKSSIKGLIVTAPWLILRNSPSKVFLSLVRFLSKVVPNLIIDTSSSVSPEIISRDKAVVEKYIQDPMVHNKVSLKMAISLNDAAIYAMENAARLDIPLLLMHGSADQITDPEGSRQFYEVNTEKFTLKIWDGLYHELHNEPEKEVVFEYLIDWVKKLD